MSIIHISIPEGIQFVDPKTEEQLDKPTLKDNFMSFEDLIMKVMDNPKWNISWKMINTAGAIVKALKDALEVGDGVMSLAGEDHKELKEAIENPKMFIIDPVTGRSGSQAGFGIHPRMSPQLIPLCDPIMTANSTDPRVAKKEDNTDEAVKKKEDVKKEDVKTETSSAKEVAA